MTRIVVPLDGSDLSASAIPLAKDFARIYQARLELVHVRQRPAAPTSIAVMPAVDDPDIGDNLQHLARCVVHEPEIPVTIHILDGEIVDSLHRFTTSENRADDSIVVMSTHGHGRLNRPLLGSVATGMVEGAAAPIALVRGPIPDRRSGLQSILVPYDGTAFARAALSTAVDLARPTGAMIGIVHVCEPPATPDIGLATEFARSYADSIIAVEREFLTSARRSLDQLAREVRSNGIRVSWEVRSGRAADEIARMAETTAADLIVMANHGGGRARRFSPAIIIDEVLSRGTTPILLIPCDASAVNQS